MKSYRLSDKAVIDFRNISRYTNIEFGPAQAKAYLTALKETVLQLAEQPQMAQMVNEIRAGYRRYLFQKHAIYFVEKDYGIYVVRVLHQQMRVELHFG
jgi:toxin ParE1/3/4